MKDIKWDKFLSIGVEEVDEDHRRLVELFNILNHAVTEGESSEYLAAVLEELINLTIWHFSHEERLMIKCGYDGLDAHRSEHRELIESVRQLQEKLTEAGMQVRDEDLEFLEHWLVQHILTEDMKLGAFLIDVM